MNHQDIIQGCRLDESVVTENGGVTLLKDNIAYGLNPVGRRVWELIQQPVEVSKVRDILLDEYAVEPERCTQELLELLDNLLAQGLVEQVNG